MARKTLATILVFLLALSVLAGCGSTTGNGGNNNKPSGTSPTQTTAHADEIPASFTPYELSSIFFDLPSYSGKTYEQIRDEFFSGVDGVLDPDNDSEIELWYIWYAQGWNEKYDAQFQLKVKFADEGTGIKTIVGTYPEMLYPLP